ncbi:hypothetical protein NKH77_12270 [Streptomyces sp. M19]
MIAGAGRGRRPTPGHPRAAVRRSPRSPRPFPERSPGGGPHQPVSPRSHLDGAAAGTTHLLSPSRR